MAHNIEKLAGFKHYTGYATCLGKPVVYHIRKSTASKDWKWVAVPQTVKIGETWVPSIRAMRLDQMSGYLSNIELQYPKPKGN